jgi:ABC-type Mn2+/Zn2+ transport system permease subunit
VTPAIVLAPLFWLDEQLPAEAGLRAARGGVMALVLITLVLVVLVNVVGVLVVVARAAVGRRTARRSVAPPSGRISA